MGNFKNELKEVVGKALFSFQGEPSESGFIIQYGHEKHIITVAKILNAVNEDKELSIDRFLSLSSSIHNSSNLLLIGEIRLLNPTNNVLGSFSIGNDEVHKHRFGRVFYDNLRMIDGDMPRLLEAIVNIITTTGIRKGGDILRSLIALNPLHIANGWEETTYRFKFGRLLYNFALGMTEETAWDGRVPNGGIIYDENYFCIGCCYFDQISLGKYLIDLTDSIIMESACYIKVIKT